MLEFVSVCVHVCEYMCVRPNSKINVTTCTMIHDYFIIIICVCMVINVELLFIREKTTLYNNAMIT